MKKYVALLFTLLVIGVFVLSFLVYRLVGTLESKDTTGQKSGSYVDSQTVQEKSLIPRETDKPEYSDYEAPEFPVPEALPDDKVMQPVTANGTVYGKLCYPSEAIPPLEVFLKNTTTGEYLKLETVQNQSTYAFKDVNEGPNFIAFAYVKGGTYGGTYSPAVACGLSVNCTDHKPQEFMVTSMGTTGIDICDWYGQPSEVPARPKE